MKDTEFTLTDGDFTQKAKADGSGNVVFNNLPLGRDYKLAETNQPNKYYRSMYQAIIGDFNGDQPKKDLNKGTIYNRKDHQKFHLVKKDAQGNPLKGAEFVLVRNDNPNPNISLEEARKTALRQIGDELVEGHSDQNPYIATSNDKGEVIFDMVETPKDKANHTYYAVEIKSPDKYTLSQTSVKFTAGETSAAVIEGELSDTTNPLPATGSEKLLIVAVGGIVLVALGGGALYFKQKVTK